VAAVTIQLDCFACAFARSTTIFSTFLRRARAGRVCAFLLVGHLYLRLNSEYFRFIGLAQLNTNRRRIGKAGGNETLSISE
jgi:hypothetical protein